MPKPNKRWEVLRSKLIDELRTANETIGAIDDATPWAPVEPQWWMQMIEFRRELVTALNVIDVAEQPKG